MSNINFLKLKKSFMKKFIFCCISFIIATTPLYSQQAFQDNIEFSVNLYKELAKQEGNLFFSPYGVSTVFLMAYAGAKGDTAKEIEKVLCLKVPQDKVPEEFKKINRQLISNAAKNSIILNSANALCINKNTSDYFKNLIKTDYSVEILNIDLAEINSWCEKKTGGKIKKMLSDISPETKLILLNAIYFKGVWKVQFNRNITHASMFNVSKGGEIRISFMEQMNDLKILKTSVFEMTAVPYMGNSVSLFIIMPNEIDGFAKFEEKLTAPNLRIWIDELDKKTPQASGLFLPKFKFETKQELILPFKELGVKSAFDSSLADFSGMGFSKGSIEISQIKHNATFEVNESGTEASASTAMLFSRGPHRPVFNANKPFVFLIRDNRTNTILFMGRLVNPAKVQNANP